MRKQKLLYAVSLVIAALAGWTALGSRSPSRAEELGEPPSLALDATSLDAHLARATAASGLVGVSVAIVRDGRIAYTGTAGRRSLVTGAGVDADTVFPIGSVTKQFTSVAVLMLVDEGKLKVTDTVARWFPRLTRAADITVHDLMTHVSGYADYYPFSFAPLWMQRPTTGAALVQDFATRPLDFEPGRAFNYSNTGYFVLGEIVAKVSGEPLGAFLQRRVFRPLGMTRTTFEPDPLPPGAATGYAPWLLGDPEPATREGHGWLGAAGGICSTASDLARWDIALMEGRLLSPSSQAILTTARTLRNAQPTGYAGGLWVGARGPHVMLSHGGGVQGFSAYNVIFPESRAALVFLTNTHPSYKGTDVYEPIVDALVPAPAATAAAEPQPAAPVPASRVAGEAPERVVQKLYLQLLHGSVDRQRLDSDFSEFLTEERVQRTAERFAAYGEPAAVRLDSIKVVGEVETARTVLTFAKGATLRATIVRGMDGRVRQLTVRLP